MPEKLLQALIITLLLNLLLGVRMSTTHRTSQLVEPLHQATAIAVPPQKVALAVDHL